jgi:hypothetical protein
VKSRNLFFLSCAFTAVLLGSFAAFTPLASEANADEAKKLTACEIAAAKAAPVVAAFKAKYLAGGAFNLAAPYRNIQETDNIYNAKAKFAALSPEQRRQVWLNKFNILTNDKKAFGDYTEAQKAFIVKFRDEVLPSFNFSEDADPEVRKAQLEPISLEIRSLFKKSDARLLFASLTTAESLNIVKVAAQVTPNCECAFGLDDFCGPYVCMWSHMPCNQVYGCGILWTAKCLGMCSQSGV